MQGKKLGLKEVDDAIWLVTIMDYNLGYIDLERKTLKSLDNPFGPRMSPMSSECTLEEMARPAGFEPATTCLEGTCSIQLSYGRVEEALAKPGPPVSFLKLQTDQCVQGRLRPYAKFSP
jgi:hypothetical protein